MLSVLDRKWREHLYEMDYLQEGIGLRAMAQRDPLVEYKREGFEMFSAMLEGIKEESVGYLFNVEVQVNPEEETEAAEARAPGGARPGAAGRPRSRRPTAGARGGGGREPGRRGTGHGQRQGAGRAGQPRAEALQYSAPTLDTAGDDGELHNGQHMDGTRWQTRRPRVTGRQRTGPKRALPLRFGQEVQECHGAPGAH